MNQFNVRVTHRTELGDRAIEHTIEIDTAAPEGPSPPPPHAATATNALEWSATLCDGERVNFKKASAEVARLNKNIAADSPHAWRLPTRMELESILDLSRHDPAVDTTRFPDTKSGWYWSATPCAWSSDRAWIVSFLNGNLNHRDDFDAFVRAVRASPSGQ